MFLPVIHREKTFDGLGLLHPIAYCPKVRLHQVLAILQSVEQQSDFQTPIDSPLFDAHTRRTLLPVLRTFIRSYIRSVYVKFKIEAIVNNFTETFLVTKYTKNYLNYRQVSKLPTSGKKYSNPR